MRTIGARRRRETSGTLVSQILRAPQRETGKEELVKSLLAPRPKAHPRRGNPRSSLYRTPPRPSGGHRKPAGTLSRRPPYSNFARTCKVVAKSAFSLTPGAARSLFGATKKRMGGASRRTSPLREQNPPWPPDGGPNFHGRFVTSLTRSSGGHTIGPPRAAAPTGARNGFTPARRCAPADNPW